MAQITRCSRCVMDDRSDKSIRFDENGFCNYCTEALSKMDSIYFPGPAGAEQLGALLAAMKKSGHNNQYDCIMGLSGGLDSSYLAYLGFKWGLRVLAVHVDDGFDSDISKRNIEHLVAATGFDYLTITPNARQFTDLTRSYMLAGVPNIAIPQDNVLFAFLYNKAKEHNIRYFASGGNFALENILQKGNTYTALDVVNIKDIHRQFGTVSIDQLKLISETEMVLNTTTRRMNTVLPLNLVEYDRDRAFADLRQFCDFEYYGRKHLENRLTEFIQLYWFSHKFGVDKRTSHLSSMIVSGQMTREHALANLANPIYEKEAMQSCIDFVCDKLHFTQSELQILLEAPPQQHEAYRTQNQTMGYKLTRMAFRALGREGILRRSFQGLRSLLSRR